MLKLFLRCPAVRVQVFIVFNIFPSQYLKEVNFSSICETRNAYKALNLS